MDTQHPLSARRLYGLIGDKIHDYPPFFIERLERRLEQFDTDSAAIAGKPPLKLVTPTLGPGDAASGHDAARTLPRGAVAVPARTLQGLDAILEILHAAHLAKQDGDPEGMLSEHLVEGLLVCGRSLLKVTKEVAAEPT